MRNTEARYNAYLTDAANIGLTGDAAVDYWQAICDRATVMSGGKLPIPQPL